ncbi:MAG: primosomal protein N' [Thermodesulfobacteriota bacterium]|nr:primosomal protein N' [Thermodesulfobacteriota bacterium]
MKDKIFAEVAPSLPLSKTFYYRVPKRFKGSIEIGKRVLVPLGKRNITGYVLGFPKELGPMKIADDNKGIKDVLDVLDDIPLFGKDELDLFHWISKYYFFPIGEVMRAALPKGINIETLQTLTITEKGKDLLSSFSKAKRSHDTIEGISDKTYWILKEIPERRGITTSRLKKRLSYGNLYTVLLRLKAEGLIEIESKTKQKRVGKKIERFIKYEGNGQSKEDLALALTHLGNKAPKQTRILKFISKNKEVSYQKLKEEFENPYSSIQKLEEKGFVSLQSQVVYRNPLYFEDFEQDSPPKLTARQTDVLKRVLEGIKSGRFSPYLLFGVTGSGKTEIYMRAVEEVLHLGKEAIVLVPEISLTSQLCKRFRTRFGNSIALLHSRLSEGERYDEWRRIKKREVQIAIGVRSAIFAPFKNLGIIIVDEEHDASYKQEEKLQYSARDIAIVRGKKASATVVLGSATPSLESYYNSQIGKLSLLSLPKRVENRPLPRVEVVDMREEAKEGSNNNPIFSSRLKEAIKDTLNMKEQVLLFLNRRGFATFVICERCGLIITCPNCSVSLVHHLKKDTVHCHYCAYSTKRVKLCPNCKKYTVQAFGLGTERIEEETKRLFPNARVARMDKDTITRKDSHYRLLKSVEDGRTDILVGTQMIAKGHDLPNVTLVGVASADTSLGFPDFRASERTFQLLTQVAGRAGRGRRKGRVIIQTYNPEHYSIQHARLHDFTSFYKEEIGFRRALNYPPFCRLINIRIMGSSKRDTAKYADDLGKISRDFLLNDGNYHRSIEILGPVVSPIERLKGKYRWQILLKGKKSNSLHVFAGQLLKRAAASIKGKGITLTVDADPISML